MRVLLVEDDLSTLKVLGHFLEKEDMRCDLASTAEEGLSFISSNKYDAIVLDLVLPDMDGYAFVEKLRDASITTPVLILSGLTDSEDKVKALCIGADDYLTKPFDKSELVARLNAIARRAKGHAQSKINIGKLSLDLDEKMACVGTKPLHLTFKEYAILELLAINKGSVLAKDDFLSHLYSNDEEPDLKIVDVFVCKLRKKLATASKGDNYIDTIWGRGYVLREPESNVQKIDAFRQEPQKFKVL